ncbi:MAG TPA: tetratricopeptide repeat protein [Flavitalea sp.]|nr:tetratricopeptide repeat protein [Flavitalea sp.]
MKRSVMIILILSFSVGVYSQRKNSYVIAGNKLYRESKYDKALPEYIKALNVSGKDPVVNYNLGNAFFRNEKFDEAAKTFDNTISNSNSALRQKSFYNKGVSMSKQNKLEESIEAYKMAVKLDPADNDARINLQKALLEMKKKMPPPPPEKKEEKKKMQQSDKSPQKQPPKSNLTKKQVEQLLKALQQREQQVQQKMQQRNRAAGQQDKDW